MNQQKPSVGRIVHYVCGRGVHRPAIVTCVHSDGESVGLHVFTCYGDSFDGRATYQLVNQAGNVEHDEAGKPTATWHWPERES